MCSRQTSGACLATDSWWTARSSTNTAALGRISLDQLEHRPALAALVAEHPVADVEPLELGDPVGAILVADIGEDDDVGLRADRAAAPRARRRRGAGGASRCRRSWSSSGHTCSRGHRLRRRRRAARRRSPALSSRKLKPCASATHSAKCGAKWSSTSSQSVISSGRRHPSSASARRDQPRRRHAERVGAGDQVRLMRLRGSAAPRRGSRGRSSRSRMPAGVSPVSATSRAARASSLSVQPSAPQRQRLVVICLIRSHRLRSAPVGQKILVVEDNELNLKLFCDLLRAHGYEARAGARRPRGARARPRLRARPRRHGHPDAAHFAGSS